MVRESGIARKSPWKNVLPTSEIMPQSAGLVYRCSIVLPCMVTAAAPASASPFTTVCALILVSDTPIRIFTMREWMWGCWREKMSLENELEDGLEDNFRSGWFSG